MRTFLTAFTALVVAACGPGVSPGFVDGGTSTTGTTWAQDVAPLVSQHCAACHVAGGIAPFALTSFQEAKPLAGALAAAVTSRSMPPWMPGGATPALRHSRALNDAQIAVFQAWVADGASEGDVANPAPLPPPDTIAFDAPELTVDTGVDYVPNSNLSDDYRCFLADLGTTEARMATAIRVTPGNRKTVHHVIATLFASADRAALQQLDDASVGPGWGCVGGPVPGTSGLQPVGGLGAWVPGVSAVAYPAGTATRVPAGSVAVIQVHYNLAGGTDPDRTRLEVKLAAPGTQSALQPIASLRLVKPTLAIPPGAKAHVEEQTATARTWSLNRFYPDGDAWVIGVGGHMHMLGRRLEVLRTDASGVQTLLDLPAWDFHWQGSYTFVEPIRVLPTDTLTLRCHYENAGAGTVTWGEGTDDEMCLAVLQIIDNRP